MILNANTICRLPSLSDWNAQQKFCHPGPAIAGSMCMPHSSSRGAAVTPASSSSFATGGMGLRLLFHSTRPVPSRTSAQRRPCITKAIGAAPQPQPPEDGGGGGPNDQQGAASAVPPPPPPPPPPPYRQRTRLTEALLSAPSSLDDYFEKKPFRSLLWLAICFAAGFYCANTVSLSFGTLAVNDVVAAAVTLGFCEMVSFVYYQAETVGLPLAMMNSFKMGVTAALIADALKLQS